MANTITLYLNTNDKAPKSATVEYDGQALTINGVTIDTDKIYYRRAYYGNCGNKLYLWINKTAYLFTMTDGWAEMYPAGSNPINPEPLHIILSIINLYAVEDCSWMDKEANNG